MYKIIIQLELIHNETQNDLHNENKLEQMKH
jgi:hypothetical protein